MEREVIIRGGYDTYGMPWMQLDSGKVRRWMDMDGVHSVGRMVSEKEMAAGMAAEELAARLGHHWFTLVVF